MAEGRVGIFLTLKREKHFQWGNLLPHMHAISVGPVYQGLGKLEGRGDLQIMSNPT